MRTDPVLSLCITLSLPPKALSPNARMHWGKRSEAVRQYRFAAKMKALAELDRRAAPLWDRAEAQALFYFADARRRDADNLAASLKAAWDGIAEAGIVANDSGLAHLPVRVLRDPYPHVVLIVTPSEVTPCE